MTTGPGLHVDFCDRKAARYAALNWHYARKMPVFKTVNFGVWENGSFRGAVIFAGGATPNLGRPYNLTGTEVCELVRVALRSHDAPVTRILSIALRLLRRRCPGLRLVVSFADTQQGHDGKIYQAGNWVYAGSVRTRVFVLNGREVHPKTLHSRYGKGGQSLAWLRANVDPNAQDIQPPPKHRYLMPLDKRMRRDLEKIAQPYPGKTEAAKA